jgi:pimeloyl-ACP methyl ester carboxylesterase
MRYAFLPFFGLVLGSLGAGAPSQTTQPAEGNLVSRMQVPLIFPGMSTQGTATARYEVPAGAERLELRAPGGERIEALFWPVATRPMRTPVGVPTVIYFYGNGQCLAHALDQAELFRRCGANVLLADYLGYGLSEGQPSESNCYAVAEALYQYALTRTDIDNRRLVAAGWSMGAAVAIDLASRHSMSGLVTFSAYTSKLDLARRQFPDMRPETLEHRFMSIEKIGGIHSPILLVHGRRDTLVPFAMSEELRQAARGKPLVYVPIDYAAHNDLFDIGAATIERQLQQFLVEAKPLPAAATRPSTQPTAMYSRRLIR